MFPTTNLTGHSGVERFVSICLNSTLLSLRTVYKYIYIYVAGTFGVYFVPPHTNVIKRNSICIYTIHISKYVYMCVQVQQKVAIFPLPLNLRSVRFLLQEMLSPARANARQFELWAEESSSVNCVVFHPCKLQSLGMRMQVWNSCALMHGNVLAVRSL